MKMILASYSRARAELLRAAGYSFEQHPSGVDERPYRAGEDPGQYVEELARAKAKAVAARFPGAFVLAADTCLYLNGRTYGKPESLDDAVDMLMELGGQTHLLITGVYAISPFGGEAYQGHDTVHVTMRRWNKTQLEQHVAIAQPLAYAGAYALQREGCALVSRLEGDPNTVIGLPLTMVAHFIERCVSDASCPQPI